MADNRRRFVEIVVGWVAGIVTLERFFVDRRQKADTFTVQTVPCDAVIGLIARQTYPEATQRRCTLRTKQVLVFVRLKEVFYIVGRFVF